MKVIKRPKTKTSSLTIRLPPKLKFGLELVCRKRGLTLSEAAMRGLEGLLESEGIDARSASGQASNLDAAWSPFIGARTLGLVAVFPELATIEEKGQAAVYRRLCADLGLDVPVPGVSLAGREIEEIWSCVQDCANGDMSYEHVMQAMIATLRESGWSGL